MAIREERVDFDGADGVRIAAFRWADDEATPRAILQISHGMAEHARRYPGPLEPLVAAGWVLYADDHRGHGLTAKGPEALGDFGEDGAEAVIDDMLRLTRLARAQHPGLPLALMGHSLGSFFGQAYVFDHSAEIDAFVLSGTAAFGEMPPMPGGPNSAIANPRTDYDWLSRDEAEVDAYIADPLCGFPRQPSAAASFARVGKRLSDPAEIAKIRKDLPIYVFVGDEDPINRKLELLRPVVDRYRAAGLKDLTVRIYQGGRHEMLNETNRAEVVRDLHAWLERACA